MLEKNKEIFDAIRWMQNDLEEELKMRERHLKTCQDHVDRVKAKMKALDVLYLELVMSESED